MSAETLLPCPFCGGTNTDPEGWMQTDINGGVSQGPTCEDCDAEAASVAAWNRRAPPAHMKAVAAVDNAARGGIVWANSAVTLETGTPLYTHPPQPDALPGELRQKVAQIIEAAIERHNPGNSLRHTLDDTDAILALIQTERGGA